MSAFDPRITPARPDLAALHLRGRVEAGRFVEGVVHHVVDASAPLRHAPQADAPLDSEALQGEEVTVYETSDEGWCWGQLASDGYVGYLPANALAPGAFAATHRVVALRTFVFPAPDIKAPPVVALPFASRVRIAREEKDFGVGGGGFIPAQHLAPLAAVAPDFVATARRFIGTAYLWGGRTSLGIDCSGLVQLALQAAGIECPRDSDMQAKLGAEIPFSGDLQTLKRGDLICWKGHIGLVAEAGRLLHANAFHMQTAEEPLAEAIARIAKGGSQVLSVRRLAKT
ncbi:MAG TPA: NlpC/P60 family protein [Xanthobacteraceae bacterium]|nr:NlpC/P60 family protein [Xanthobacteraceae bacterium]